MQVTGDVCNGIKHLVLTTTKTGDLDTAISTQNVTISPMPVFVTTGIPGTGPTPPRTAAPATATHSWNVTSHGQPHDVLDLCDEVIARWTTWCTDKGIL